MNPALFAGVAASMRRHARTRLLALAFLASAVTASAQIPVGAEFRVDTMGADRGFWRVPRTVAMAPDGRFAVAWVTGYSDIVARLFTPAGVPLGPDFIVNSPTAFATNESIAMDDAGNFVVAWANPAPGGFPVFGQRFDSAGARVGAEFQVSDSTNGYSPRVFVAMRPAGEFVVAWAHPYGRDAVRARRFDASANPLGGSFQVNTSTTAANDRPSLDFDAAGNFVVVWGSHSSPPVVRGQRFTAAGAPLGTEFQANGGTESAVWPRVARAPDGSFVVTWVAWGFPTVRVVARRFDPSGVPLGAEFTVGPMSPDPFNGSMVDIDIDRDGDFVIVWDDWDTLGRLIRGRRYDSAGTAGTPFLVTGHGDPRAGVASDAAGNFVVAWRVLSTAPLLEVRARRYAGGLMGIETAVDSAAGPTSDGNGVFEAGETATVAPSWLNANFTAQTFSGTASSFTGPGGPGNPTYTIADGAASYGTVASGDTASCTGTGNCYTLGISVPSVRPAVHWDASFLETMAPAHLGGMKTWTLHVGDSFTDVPRASGFYRFVETVLHNGVTTGCGGSAFCPSSSTTREQMAVFALVAKEGPGFAPPACTNAVPRPGGFADVPVTSPFCPWIEELARRGVVAGCGGGNYCPGASVSREQMAVFVLRAQDPALSPPACGAPMFADVPASSPFCPWIEELARRGVVAGCGGGNYCPATDVTREQMSVFLTATFGLVLYGP